MQFENQSAGISQSVTDGENRVWTKNAGQVEAIAYGEVKDHVMRTGTSFGTWVHWKFRARELPVQVLRA